MAQEHALALEGCLLLTAWPSGHVACVFFWLHIMALLGVLLQADGETKMCNKEHSLIILVYSRDLQQKSNW